MTSSTPDTQQPAGHFLLIARDQAQLEEILASGLNGPEGDCLITPGQDGYVRIPLLDGVRQAALFSADACAEAQCDRCGDSLCAGCDVQYTIDFSGEFAGESVGESSGSLSGNQPVGETTCARCDGQSIWARLNQLAGPGFPSPSDAFREKAQAALKLDAQVTQAWMADRPGTQRLHRDANAYAISTQGARRHAQEAEILRMAARLLSQDWGDIEYQEDTLQNEENARRDQGAVMGVYQARDGVTLWAMQAHRFVPPTIMLPDER